MGANARSQLFGKTLYASGELSYLEVSILLAASLDRC
jgi:hypothetical protein